MSCDRVRRLISEGYDRRLSTTERVEIAEHLPTCAACERFERALRSSLDGVSELPEIAPSTQLWERVHTRRAMMPGVTPSRLARQAAGMLGAAAVVGLVAVLTIFLLNNSAGTNTTTSDRPGIAAGAIGSPAATSAITSALVQQTPATPAPSPSPSSAVSSIPIATSSAETMPSIAAATPSAQTVDATPRAVDEKAAEDTVVGYFHAINVRDFPTAYGHLGSAMQQNQSLADFTTGYAQTKHDTLTITATKPDQSGQVVVVIYLDAEQTDGSVRHYHGEYIVGFENGVPKIVDANVTEDLPATPTPSVDSSAAGCLADNLSATVDYQGTTGSMAGSIIVTNTGNDPCTLLGTPFIKILNSDQQEFAVDQKTMNLDGNQRQVTIAPGQQASLFFVWSNWCPAGIAETSSAAPMTGGVQFQVALPDGRGQTTATAKRPDGTLNTLVPRCDAPGQTSTLSIGRFKPYPAP